MNNSFAPDGPDQAVVDADATSSPGRQTKAVFASFNILHGRIANGQVDLELYADTVASLGADVVGLQEVDYKMLRSSRADLAAVAGDRCGLGHYFGKAIRRADLGKDGLAVLGPKLVTAETIRLPRRSWKLKRRIAIEARVLVNGTEWRFVNTHLSLDKVESAQQLSFLLDRLSSVEGPVVLVGDFNRKPEEVQSLTGGDWHLGDSGPTYPSWGPRERIDYVLARNATINNVEVRQTPISDHCALIATVTP